LGGSRTHPDQPQNAWLVAEFKHAPAENSQSVQKIKARQQWFWGGMNINFDSRKAKAVMLPPLQKGD
jgi:hypothetical protein